MQYLAIGFAYDDWNENQVSDPLEGMPRGIDRVQNPKLLPQDSPFTSDVYFRLGYIYFDEAKYPEAIEVWRLALKRWPMDPQAPEVQNSIALAYTRHNEQAEAIAARAKLSDFGEGSDWWEANKDHPVEQRRAEQLAEDALVNTAIAHHQRAQELRRRCVEQQEPDLCTQAQEQYGLAALAYRGYIQRYPEQPARVRAELQPRRRAVLVGELRRRRQGVLRGARLEPRRQVPVDLGAAGGRIDQAPAREEDDERRSRRCAPSRRPRAARRPRSRRSIRRSCCSVWRARVRPISRASTKRTTPKRCATRTSTTTRSCSTFTATGMRRASASWPSSTITAPVRAPARPARSRG